MKLTAMAMVLLLCAYSFFAGEARASKFPQMREAWRAAVTHVKGLPAAAKSAVGITLIAAALCIGGTGCDLVDAPSYVGDLHTDQAALSTLGISSADADRYADKDIWKTPAEYDGKLIVFSQNGVFELGVASDGGRHNELVITDLEKKNGRRTIIKVWQVKGVMINDSSNVGKTITVEAGDARRRANNNFKEDKEARRILANKEVQLFGEVTEEFSGGWLLFVPEMGLGFKPDPKKWLDLGIRAFLEPVHLFTEIDSVLSWAEPKAEE